MSKYSDLRWIIADLEKELAEERVFNQKLKEEIERYILIIHSKDKETEELREMIKALTAKEWATMTEKQAYKILMNTPIIVRKDPKEYSKALHIAMSALSRQIPKNANGMFDSVPHYRCPYCGKSIVMFCDDKHYPNCHWCGQKLDWRNAE